MKKAPPDNPQLLFLGSDAVVGDARCAQLALAGWGVSQTTDPMEALAVARGHRVDLVFLQLPLQDVIDMDLPTVLRSVCPSYLPVVVVADRPDAGERCRFLECGADEIVTDSTTPEEMIARVRSLLRIRQLHEQLQASRSALMTALHRERLLLRKLREDNEQLQALATTDALTRVQNARFWRDILDHEFREARRYGHPLSLLMLDVDHFKIINDTHGHPSGDYVLKELAVILKQSIRESDVVARIGGEEFSIILPRAERERALALARRIVEEVRRRVFSIYGRSIRITISAGVASWPEDAEIVDPEMLWYFADQALLMAKESGRDRIESVHGLGPGVRQRLCRQYLSARLLGKAAV